MICSFLARGLLIFIIMDSTKKYFLVTGDYDLAGVYRTVAPARRRLAEIEKLPVRWLVVPALHVLSVEEIEGIAGPDAGMWASDALGWIECGYFGARKKF